MFSYLSPGFHLPLNAVDKANEPPLYFLWVQDGCIISTGILWTVAYILYIRQATRDKSYGMPLIAVCANIGWELIYGVFHPLSYAEMVTFIPWFFIDLGIVYTTVQYGAQKWKHSPMIANNLLAILSLGSIFSLLMHWAFIKTCVSVEEAAFWSGFACQNLLGVSSVAQLMSRNETSGHSWTIWLCRWIGSLLTIIMFSWRHYHYPEDYPAVSSPMAAFLFVSMELADFMYPLVYKSIAEQSWKKFR
ncbi:hypothetical protein EV127DRAFT_376513 [Xylaria flabelliformis]|nr:hypothetical protein EV127DRAFT_376513 [Xylaria flabelliformis]